MPFTEVFTDNLKKLSQTKFVRLGLYKTFQVNLTFNRVMPLYLGFYAIYVATKHIEFSSINTDVSKMFEVL